MRSGRITLVGLATAILLAVAGTAGANAGPPAQVIVSFSQGTIAANGSSTTLVTATVQDASGTPVSGQSVTIASSDAGDMITAPSGITSSAGTFSATLQASSSPGPATITATDTTPITAIAGQATLYQYGSPSQLTIGVNPLSIVADGTSTATATATVTDGLGDPVPGQTVTITSSAGNTIGSVTGDGEGDYSATVTSTTSAGPVTLTATDSTVPAAEFSNAVTLTQSAGPATDVVVSLTPTAIVADGSATTTAKATVTDANGNPVSGDDVRFSSNDNGELFSGFTANGDGTYDVTITSSTTVHQVTVTASDVSVLPAVSGHATLNQTPGPATSVALHLSPTTIIADGSSHTTATATLTDAENHPVPGQAVTFASSDPQQGIGAVTDNGDGTYTATITSSTTLGQSTITAHDGALANTASLTQTAGPAAGIVVKLAPASIVADGTSKTTATATVTDAENHPLSGQTVTLGTSDGGQTIGPVTDHHDGTYSAAITSSTALGQSTITAHDGTLAGTATLTQTVGPPALIALQVTPSSIIADGTSIATATATVTDAENHRIAGQIVTIGSSDSAQMIGAVKDNGDGSYTATITASTALGSSTITARDGALTGTASLSQTAGPAADLGLQLSPSSIIADGSSTTTATVTITDAEHHVVPGETVTLTSTDTGQRIGAVTDEGNGTYTATVTGSTALGASTITARDGALTSTATLTQTAGPAATIALTLTPATIVADGTAATAATATVTDAEGHPLAGDNVTVSSSDRSERIGAVHANGDGTYTATITSSTTIGKATITAKDGSAVATAALTQTVGPPGIVTIALAPASIIGNGTATTTATATVTDTQGNPVAGAKVSFTSSDPHQQIGSVHDAGNGAYTTTITGSTTLGQSTITAAAGLATGTTTLTETAQPAAKLVIGLAHPSVLADGSSTDTALVLVTDAAGHPLNHQPIAITTSDLGDGVGAATDYGNGGYSALITSSTTVHAVTVTATDYSTAPALSATVTLMQTPGPARSITLSFKPSSLVANGRATTTITLTVKDGAGHLLPGQQLSVRGSDPGDRFGAVKAGANATYSVRLRSSRTPHRVRISAIDRSVTPAVSVTAVLIQTRPRAAPGQSSAGSPSSA